MADLGAIGVGAVTATAPGAVPAGGPRGVTAAAVSLPIMTWLGITTLPPGSPWTASVAGSENFVAPVRGSAFAVPAFPRVLGR